MTKTEVITIAKAAELAGVTQEHIRRLMSRGELKRSNSLGEKWALIDRASFDEWLTRRKPAGRPKEWVRVRIADLPK